jgi:hypothetical protein
VAVAQFLGAVFEQADDGLVDVAEAEEAEVVSWYGGVLEGQISQSFKSQSFKVSERSSEDQNYPIPEP